jgi:hypothetical protein
VGDVQAVQQAASYANLATTLPTWNPATGGTNILSKGGDYHET